MWKEVYLPKTNKKTTTAMKKSIYFYMILPLFTHFFIYRETLQEFLDKFSNIANIVSLFNSGRPSSVSYVNS